MNKRCISCIMVLIVCAAMVVYVLPAPLSAQAQGGDPLDCPAFPNAATNVRASYYMGEGMGYLASGERQRAITSFSCIIEQIDQGYVPAYMGRAAAYAGRHDYEKSREDYNAVIGLDAGYLPAYNNRGIVYAAEGDYDLALADFDQVISRDSSYVLAYNNRAVIYAIQGDFASAISDVEQAIALSGIDDVVAELTDPNRDPDATAPEYDLDHAQSYALLGIIYSARALDNYAQYLLLTGSQGDQRIQSAAGALESRFNFELRLDDGTWLLTADFSPVQ